MTTSYTCMVAKHHRRRRPPLPEPKLCIHSATTEQLAAFFNEGLPGLPPDGQLAPSSDGASPREAPSSLGCHLEHSQLPSNSSAELMQQQQQLQHTSPPSAVTAATKLAGKAPLHREHALPGCSEVKGTSTPRASSSLPPSQPLVQPLAVTAPTPRKEYIIVEVPVYHPVFVSPWDTQWWPDLAPTPVSNTTAPQAMLSMEQKVLAALTEEYPPEMPTLAAADNSDQPQPVQPPSPPPLVQQHPPQQGQQQQQQQPQQACSISDFAHMAQPRRCLSLLLACMLILVSANLLTSHLVAANLAKVIATGLRPVEPTWPTSCENIVHEAPSGKLNDKFEAHLAESDFGGIEFFEPVNNLPGVRGARQTAQKPQKVHYRCSACVAKSEGVPVSDSAPLRVLHLYALIATRDDGATPMRMKPVRLVVHAPPDTWQWGASAPASGSLQDVEMAHPTQSGALFLYNKKESDALWSWSSCYRGEDRDSSSF